jgi:exonuclease I
MHGNITKKPYAYAQKSDLLFHRLRKGILFNAYYDTETTDLDKRFSEILQFGGLITDLGGNVVQAVDLRGKPSGYNVISPFAWVVQKLSQNDLQRGEPQYLLAGRIMQFFRQANSLASAPFASP